MAKATGTATTVAQTPAVAEAAEADVVRFNLYLPKEAFEALAELQKLTGKRSLAETVRAALRLYRVAQLGAEEDKELFLIDKKSKEKEKLVLI